MSSTPTLELNGKAYVVKQIGVDRTDAQRGLTTRLFEAWDNHEQRTVVLKHFVFANTKHAPRLRQAAKAEARLMGQIRHSGLPLLVGSSVHATGAWLEMEFIPGETLDQRYLSRSTVPDAHTIRAILKLVGELAAALVEVHQREHAHRDVSPSNIMLPNRRAARLIDFGLAALEPAIGEEGTPGYRAPEQMDFKPELTMPGRPSDVYGLGAVLYHLLTQTLAPLPLPNDQPDAPSITNPAVSQPLDQLVLTMLAYQPTARPTMKQVQDRLNHIDRRTHAPFVATATAPPNNEIGTAAQQSPAVPAPEPPAASAQTFEAFNTAVPPSPEIPLESLYNQLIPEPAAPPVAPPMPRTTPAHIVNTAPSHVSGKLVALVVILLVLVLLVIAILFVYGR